MFKLFTYDLIVCSDKKITSIKTVSGNIANRRLILSAFDVMNFTPYLG